VSYVRWENSSAPKVILSLSFEGLSRDLSAAIPSLEPVKAEIEPGSGAVSGQEAGESVSVQKEKRVTWAPEEAVVLEEESPAVPVIREKEAAVSVTPEKVFVGLESVGGGVVEVDLGRLQYQVRGDGRDT